MKWQEECYCMELTLTNKDTKVLKDLILECIREHKSAIDMVTTFNVDKYLTKKINGQPQATVITDLPEVFLRVIRIQYIS